MKSVMAQADAALPRYHEVAEALRYTKRTNNNCVSYRSRSLRLGDESTSLEKAQEMRFKLMKLHEAVDILRYTEYRPALEFSFISNVQL